MKQQRGYTLIELIICIAFIAMLALVGGGLYILFHFIAKAW